jgi:hypothetical protein
MAALVLLFGLGGALVVPPDQRDVVVNPEILTWSLLVEAGWFGGVLKSFRFAVAGRSFSGGYM